ncbi:MAG: acyltransferase family protein [Gaiellaceae bacterium]
MEQTGPRLAYRPGLDGLRAIAVAGVFLYHSRIDWLPGGFLGVDLFFVLSGYLITSILLVEWEARNRIDLRRFWLRRARRLLPALVVVVLAALILAAIFARDDLARTRGDAVSSLLYYTNWHEIVANHSYFNLMGRPSLLQHLWSLAVEEQFYLIWPLLLVPGLVLLGRKRLPFLAAAGIAGSGGLMWLLYNPTDPTRVWNGTDTRAFLLLMGILLALVWPYVERLRRALPLLELFGVAALVATVLLFRQMHDYDPTLWQGGDLAASFCFVVLIAAVAHPGTGLGEALGVQPLRWLGERSYGIYLWHWPVIELMRPGVDISWTGPGVVVAQAAIVLTAAELSYRFVEQPIRTGSLQRRLAERPRRLRLELVGAGLMGLIAAFSVLFVIPSPVNPITSYVNPPKVHAATKPKPSQTDTVPRQHQHTSDPGTTRTPEHALPAGQILALGDSVMLGCSRQLKGALLHRVRVDATVGRQIEDTVQELDHLRHKHALPKTLVIQIGNNGPLWYRDLVKLREALRGIPDIVFVNVRNATSWQDESNHALVDWLRGWRVAHLADWYGQSTNKMLSDGTHPWPYACTIYAHVIASTLRST